MNEAPQAPLPPMALPAGVDERTVFRSLFVSYPDSLLVVDPAGGIVMANPSAARMLGYTTDELVGLNVDQLVPEAMRPRHAGLREAYGQAPRPRPMGTQMELAARRKDGSEVMIEIALSPLQAHGLPLVVAAIRDIGSYPRVKQALQRARYSEHLAQLGRLAVDARDAQEVLEELPQIAAQALQVDLAMVFLLTPDRREFRVASGVGLLPEEPVGTRLPNRPETPPGFVLAEGRPVTVDDFREETRFQVPPAYLAHGLVSALSVPLADRGQLIGALAVRARVARRFGADETRFMESLANLLATSLQRAQTEEALAHAQRLESVGQLTGGIAHDFNNLLTVIQGNLQVLEELPAVADDTYGQQLLAAAMRASRRGAELTSKLLAFSRRQVLQPEPVDSRALLHSLSDMLRRTLDQRIVIEVDVPADCPPVLADPGQLESALLNIAINARDAMPQGGRLCFRATPCQGLPNHVTRELGDPSATAERFMALSVQDTGTGMSEEVRERAFEPFFTTKEAGRGTGLGLSTVYGFAKQSKGAIAIDSAPGAGTTVTLYIPRPWHSRPVAEDDAATQHAVPPGLKVLVVEDDPEVRRVVRTFLQGLRCEVTTASTAEQALPLLAGEQPFDLLLTDIALGAGMRGTQLASQAQRLRPALAILLTSGFSAELLDADRDAPPSWELLRKPYTRGELARAVGSVMAGRAGTAPG